MSYSNALQPPSKSIDVRALRQDRQVLQRIGSCLRRFTVTRHKGSKSQYQTISTLCLCYTLAPGALVIRYVLRFCCAARLLHILREIVKKSRSRVSVHIPLSTGGLAQTCSVGHPEQLGVARQREPATLWMCFIQSVLEHWLQWLPHLNSRGQGLRTGGQQQGFHAFQKQLRLGVCADDGYAPSSSCDSTRFTNMLACCPKK